MNRVELDSFEKVVGQMQSVYDELSILSKKSPSDAVNAFKLGLINKLLEESSEVLGTEYWPFGDFKQFDLDEIPQNSDVVFILSQCLQGLEKLRADNVVPKGGFWQWELDAENEAEGKTYVRSTRPKRLRE